MLTGHKGPILDLDFSPHYENILATASADCTVAIWTIPEEGLQASTD